MESLLISLNLSPHRTLSVCGVGCDTNGANTTSFTDSALAKDVPLALGITAVSGTPGYVRVHVRCRR